MNKISLFNFFKTYWGHLMTIVAAGTFVWGLGVKSERKSNEKILIKEDIEIIKSDISYLKDQVKKIDYIYDTVIIIRNTQSLIINNQNAMRNSYVEYIAKNKGITKEEFLTLMNGLEFQMASPDTESTNINKFPEPKITIRKINKQE